MANFFGSLARKSQIDGLTSPKDEPCPVYALQELVDVVRKADSRAVHDVARYLCTSRLSNKSLVVKTKTLRAIKYVASKGECGEFRMAVQQHSGALRECVNFSCPADPMKGSKPAEGVRQAAKEAIHSVFSTDTGDSGAGRQHTMQGFGSTSEKASTMFSVSSSSGSGSNASSAASGSKGSGIRLSWGGRSNGSHTQAPQFAGSLDNSPRSPAIRKGPMSAPFRESQGPAVPMPSHFSAAGVGAGTGSRNEPSSSAASIDRIEQMLEQVCTRKGMKLQPAAEDVKKYVSAAQDVHLEDLWLTLKVKLSEGPWQQQYIGLCLLQALTGCHNKAFGNAVCAHVAGDCACVQRLAAAQHKTLSGKAKSLLAKISPGSSGAATAQAQQPQQQQQQQFFDSAQPQGGDLLDLGLDAAPPAIAPAPPQQVDLLQELGGQPAQQQQQHQQQQLPPAPTPAPAQAPAAVGATGDLFAGLSVAGGGPPPPQPAPAAAASAGGASLFDGMAINADPVVPPAAQQSQQQVNSSSGGNGAAAAAAAEDPVRRAMSPLSPAAAAPGGQPQMQAAVSPPFGPQGMGMGAGMGMMGMGMNPMQMQAMQQQQMMMMMMQQQQQQQMMMAQQQQPNMMMMMGMQPPPPNMMMPQQMPPPAMMQSQKAGAMGGGGMPQQATAAATTKKSEPAFNFVQDHMKSLKGG